MLIIVGLMKFSFSPPPVSRIWFWSRRFCWYFCCSPVAANWCLTGVGRSTRI